MAATDLERLVVQLSADLKGYENAMRRAQGVTSQRLGQIQKKAMASSTAISGAFLRSGAAIASAFAANEIVRGAAELSDAATRIDNSLKVAGLSGEELEKVYDRLNKAAIAHGAPIETLATLYGKAAQSQKELGVSSEELLGFTNNVALALRVAGTDAQSASGALLQLGQALGSGKVQAEEFNSILEGAPTIAQAVAAGLKEAGGSVAKLKSLVVDGKISSEAFFRAFEAGAPMLEQKVAGSVFTIEQALGNFRTALTNVARDFDKATGAGQNFAQAINTTAKVVNGFDVSGLIEKVRKARLELDEYLNSLGNADVFKRLAQGVGALDADGNVINLDASKASDETASLEKEVKLLQDRIELNTKLGFDNTEALARLDEVQKALAQVRANAAGLANGVPLPGSAGGNGNIQPVHPLANAGPLIYDRFNPAGGDLKPVSVKDFKPPVGKSSGSRKADEFQREIEQIKERTIALQAETAAQAGVNPLIDDYGFAVEKARAKQDLLNAAHKAGIAITPELQANIDRLATGYADASVAAEKLQESQDRAREAAEDFKETAKDITSGFISDLRSGKSAVDALANALNKVLDKLIDIGLNDIFGTGGSSNSGFATGLLKIFGFAKGGVAARGRPMKTFAKGGVSKSAAIFGEAGPEAAVPLPDGKSIPVKFQMPSVPSRAANGNVSVDARTTIQASGNEDTDRKLMAWAQKRDAELPGQIIRTVKEAQKRRQL